MARTPRKKMTYGRNLLNFKDRAKTKDAIRNIKSPYQLNGTNGDLGSKSKETNPRKRPTEITKT